MKTKTNKTYRISIRLNEYENSVLANKINLADISVSMYIRHIILHSKAPIHKVDKYVVNELSRIGNNINQIARHINTNKTIDCIALSELVKIEKLLNRINPERISNDSKVL